MVTLGAVVRRVGKGRQERGHQARVHWVLVVLGARTSAATSDEDDVFLARLLLHGVRVALLRGVETRVEVEEHAVARAR